MLEKEGGAAEDIDDGWEEVGRYVFSSPSPLFVSTLGCNHRCGYNFFVEQLCTYGNGNGNATTAETTKEGCRPAPLLRACLGPTEICVNTGE